MGLTLSHLTKVSKSATLLLNEQSRNLEASTTIYKFGFGQSPFPPPAYIIDALREHAKEKHYTEVRGLPALREAVAKFHNDAEGLDYEADSILIAPGSKVLLYAIMASFTKADVFIPAPAWVSYVPQAQMLGHQVFVLQTKSEDKWRLTPDLLERALESKEDKTVPSILITNYPGNPGGKSYTDSELKNIAEVLRRYNVLAISDEIYGFLHHKGEHRSLAHHYAEGTIVTSGLSKWCGAGGWRLGVALMPNSIGEDFKDTILGVASEIYSCAPTPVQLAAIKAYDFHNPELQAYLTVKRELMRTLAARIVKPLSDSGIQVNTPDGAFYLFLDFMPLKDKIATHGITTSGELCSRLLSESHVAILPGTSFGMQPDYLSARLAYVEFDGETALNAALGGKKIDDAFLEEYCPKVLTGIETLCNSHLLTDKKWDQESA